MTKFVLLALIFAHLPLLAADCDRLLGGDKPRQDYVFMQREIWGLEQKGKTLEANALRARLETWVRIARQSESVADVPGLYRATDMAFVRHRSGQDGFKDYLGYLLNESLGRPVRIPVTASRINGSKQLWLFYEFKEEMLSADEDRKIDEAIQADGDLFLFNYLMANTDQYPQNVILDRDFGLVVSGFEAGLKYTTANFIYYSRPKEMRKKEIEQIQISDVMERLREGLAKTKSDWRSKLESFDEHHFAAEIRLRIGPVEAREFVSRVCILRSLLNGTNPSLCHAKLP